MRDIVFVSDRDTNLEIYSMTSLGTQQTNLSQNRAQDTDPSWSPNGQKIVFVRWMPGRSEIWVMSASGASQTRVSFPLRGSPPYADGPRWSPDGTRIAFVRSAAPGAPGDLYTIALAGGLEKSLTTGGGVLNAAAWSPNGSQLAFVRGPFGSEFLYRVNADGTGLTQLATANVQSGPPPERGPEPCWSPGPRILYTDNFDGHNFSDLMSIDPAGGLPTRLTTYGQSKIDGVVGGCWSPNSSRITLTVFLQDEVDVVAMNPDGSGKVNLTNNPTEFISYARGFNQSMTQILYYRNQVEAVLYPHQVYTMKPDGTGQTRLTGRGSNTDPAWRP